MESHGSLSPVSDAPFHARPLVSGYVQVPRSLLMLFRRTPLTIGVWMLIARQYVLQKQAVPLSVHDIQRYDPQLTTGAITRALQALGTHGWVQVQHVPGGKSCYRPTWGTIRGTPRPWDLQAPALGCPRHVARIRVDQRLLDTYMGRMDPYPIVPADVQRYYTRPLLSLKDIGSYAQLWVGHGRGTPTLEALALVRHGYPCGLPSDDALLATVSQQPLFATTDVRLSDAGTRRLGLPVAAPPPAPSTGQPLLFLAPELLGHLLGRVIAADPSPCTPSAAAACAKPARASTGLMDARINAEHASMNPPPPNHRTGGGIALPSSGHICSTCNQPVAPSAQPEDGYTSARLSRSSSTNAAYTQQDISAACSATARPHHGDVHPHPARDKAVPDTLTTKALRGHGVLPTQVQELADLPLTTIQTVIQASISQSGVRDRAAWTVNRLRAVRQGYPLDTLIAAPATDGAWATSRQWLQERGWCDADPSSVPATPKICSADDVSPHGGKGTDLQVLAHHVTPDVAADPATCADRADVERQLVEVPGATAAGANGAPECVAVPDRSCDTDTSALTTSVRKVTGWLEHAVPEARALIRRLTIQVTPERMLLNCADSTCYEQLQPHLVRIRAVVRAEGVSQTVQVRIARTPASQPDRVPEAAGSTAAGHAHEACPVWMTPDHWITISGVLRAALVGATLVNGCIQARSAPLQHVLDTRCAAEVAQMLTVVAAAQSTPMVVVPSPRR